MGLGYPPDWGEYTARLRSGDLTLLEEDMSFYMISGIWQDGVGVEISEIFHVTSIGAETLAELPRKLFFDLIGCLRFDGTTDSQR
jgi:Xaa-Pro dipeptidase